MLRRNVKCIRYDWMRIFRRYHCSGWGDPGGRRYHRGRGHYRSRRCNWVEEETPAAGEETEEAAEDADAADAEAEDATEENAAADDAQEEVPAEDAEAAQE